MTTITALPTPPTRQDPINFADRADEFLAALPTFATETNAVASEINDKYLAVINADIIAENLRGQWVTATAYALKDVYTDNGIAYIVVVSHTSTSIANDVVNGKVKVWQGVLFSDLAAPSGASLVGYMPAGVGAVDTDVENKLRETVSVEGFGAVGGGTDDTSAFNKAVLHLALLGGGKLITPAPAYTLLGKVIVPSNVEIDLCKSVIAGSLTNTLFETGYLSGGAIITNIGTANESHAVYGTCIHNGTIRNSLLAFNAFNFLAGCEFSDIILYDCVQNVYAKRSFYNSWKNIYSANTVLNTRPGIAAWTFDDNNNAVHFDRVFTTGRDIAYLFKGAMFQGRISGLSAENGVKGIVIENETFALEISGNYFEDLSGAAIDLTYAAQKTNLVIDNNFFHGPGVGIQGQLMIGGSIGAGNTFSGCSNNVIITDDNFSSIEVHIPSNGDSSIAGFLPTLPSGYTLGKKVKVVGFSNIYDNASGTPLINAKMTNGPGGLVDLYYSGDCGMVSGKIPFCTHASSSPGATNFSVLIDTKILYSPYVMLMFAVQISDGTGAHLFSGRIYGLTVFLDGTGGGRTASANYSSGFVQLQLDGLVNPGGAYGAEGIVRIV